MTVLIRLCCKIDTMMGSELKMATIRSLTCTDPFFLVSAHAFHSWGCLHDMECDK